MATKKTTKKVSKTNTKVKDTKIYFMPVMMTLGMIIGVVIGIKINNLAIPLLISTISLSIIGFIIDKFKK